MGVLSHEDSRAGYRLSSMTIVLWTRDFIVIVVVTLSEHLEHPAGNRLTAGGWPGSSGAQRLRGIGSRARVSLQGQLGGDGAESFATRICSVAEGNHGAR